MTANTRHFVHSVLALIAWLLPAVAGLAAESKAVRLNTHILNGFIQKHCVECHGPKKQKGETRLDTLSRQIGDSATALHWQEVLDVLNLGEMPPEDEPQPGEEELEPVLAHLTSSLTLARRRLAETGGDIALRRINRREYRNTIEDLMGLRASDAMMPPDDIAEGYDTVGQDQQFSSYHFEGYFEAGKKIVETGLFWADRPRAESATKKEEVEKRIGRLRGYVSKYDGMMDRIKAGEGYQALGFNDEKALQMYIARHPKRTGQRRAYLEQPHIDTGVYLDGENIKTGVSIVENADPRARYRLRIVGGLNGNPPLLRQFVEVRLGGSSIGQLRIGGTITHPETQEMTFRPTLDQQQRAVINISENRNTHPKIAAYVKAVDPGGKQSSIWIDRLETEGPFYPEPSIFETLYDQYIGKGTGGLGKDGNAAPTGRKTPGRRKNSPGVRKSRQDEAASKVAVASDRGVDDERARQFIEAFAFHAFRNRKPSPEFVAKLHGIYALRRDHEHSLTSALVTPLAMVLSSPSFLYLMEDTPIGEAAIGQRDFANRLSHFLWSRSPDAELYRCVAEGTLDDPRTLRAQVERMLRHSHRWALAEGFMAQWADLTRFDDIAIDQKQHLRFNHGIRRSARLEPLRFFDALIEENFSIHQFIDSDFVTIDSLLGSHYGVELSEPGNHFRKVALPPESPRGGLLGQMAFLTMGSNGERSSPIIRGALIMDRFLNRTPPPPPPNVPELASASDQALTVKEIVDLHQRKAQCASCHRSFDPLGFGLENFDLLGQWRDLEVVGNIGKRVRGQKNAIPIRAQGAFPDQKEFHNLAEFKAGLMARKELLTRSLAEGLLTYALGRHLEFSDQQAVDEICSSSRRNGGKIRDLLHTIVSHPIFRRGDQPAPSSQAQAKN